MIDEKRLIEKLRSIEALFAGAMTPGEKDAAGRARERIIARIADVQAVDPAVECQFSMPDPWSRRVFVALLRRYGLDPYRYKRQRKSTIVVKIPESFANEILLPEFNQISRSLHEYLTEVTDRVVAEVLEVDSSDPAQVETRPIPASVSEQ